ncbi:MAG TPA: nitroreductase family deazaflavin-dependent oxidoreductase [Anaerolineales bacterium]|nr:nitroreductase family deazaflavin-dependent oxidoreductase [Anaerolineales bacterium]
MPIIERQPRGILRWGLRLPIWLYRLRLGWLLGERFLLLTHTGRKSGLPRQTVLEVIRHDPATNTYFVAAAWGDKSDWFRNILHDANVTITVRRRNLATLAERLSVEAGTSELLDYAHRYPRAFREITRVVTGQPLVGTPEICRQLSKSMPVVALRPRSTAG